MDNFNSFLNISHTTMVRCFVLLLVLVLGRIVQGQPEVKGKVIKVEEGDLLQILTSNKDTISIRLANVDSPEPGQEYFEQARRYTEKLCLKKTVKFIPKGKNEEDIETGFLVLPNNQTLNYALVEAGLAWHFKKGLQFTIEIQTLSEKEDKAKSLEKGLWKSKAPVAPWIYKRNITRYEAKTSY
ncbi:MAG TPA: thermonuclease family protein [Cytophagales bacterium]|nr:thermonuclease family protein [Cytophagales bacterium]